MLHFDKIILENFGPYKGKQNIDLSQNNGTIIFWGDNGRGKTTLLNAFRYVLFGIIRRRKGILQSLREIENKEAAEENNFGFSVTLIFSNEIDLYELKRSFTLRNDIQIPNSDDDYENNVFLKKNGDILPEEAREHELNQIMPEQVSRFFLFDAELLEEYEQLLDNDSSSCEKIKTSIEKILGVPALTNSVTDIKILLTQFDKAKETEAAKDAKTKQLSGQLTVINEEISNYRTSISDLQKRLDSENQNKHDIEDKMSETENVRGWIATRDQNEKLIKNDEDKLQRLYTDLKQITNDIWKGMLHNNITSLIDNLKPKENELESKKTSSDFAKHFILKIRSAMVDCECPVCQQKVNEEQKIILKKKIEELTNSQGDLTSEEQKELTSIKARISILNSLLADNKKDTIALLEKQIAETIINIEDLKQESAELNSKIKKQGAASEIETLRKLSNNFADTLKRIEILRSGINEENNKLTEAIANKERIDNLIIKNASSEELKKLGQKEEICNKIYQIFEKGLIQYREDLKTNVEKDATIFFKELTEDKDYIKLQINNNYGLEIIHKSGEIVPGRSSGYEHIVALSLIGALHSNAPLEGPIIMDSPFGRLDPTHTKNIVKILPKLAKQSILLAYSGEIDEQVAREELKGNLLYEYKLTKRTSMNTCIEKM